MYFEYRIVKIEKGLFLIEYKTTPYGVWHEVKTNSSRLSKRQKLGLERTLFNKVKRMAQKYIKDDIVMYDNRIHTIIDTLGLNNYELSYIRHQVNREELSGVHITPEFLKKNGWKKFKRPYSRDYCFRRKGYPTLNIRSNNEVYFHWGDHDKSITAVHQLQHLLFGLGLNSDMEV
jgi:hypothetical protein